MFIKMVAPKGLEPSQGFLPLGKSQLLCRSSSDAIKLVVDAGLEPTTLPLSRERSSYDELIYHLVFLIC